MRKNKKYFYKFELYLLGSLSYRFLACDKAQFEDYSDRVFLCQFCESPFSKTSYIWHILLEFDSFFWYGYK